MRCARRNTATVAHGTYVPDESGEETHVGFGDLVAAKEAPVLEDLTAQETSGDEAQEWRGTANAYVFQLIESVEETIEGRVIYAHGEKLLVTIPRAIQRPRCNDSKTRDKWPSLR